MPPGDADSSRVIVDDVLITSELSRRARSPDYEGENRALVALATTISESPETVLQMLAECALELCRAGSAGVSVLERGAEDVFRWRAAVGDYARYLGNTLPRNFSPCGAVVDRNACLLMAEPVRFFPYISELCSPVSEALLIPFHRNGEAIGTVWVVAHNVDKHFDAEDARLITSLTKFASAAVVTLNRIEEAEHESALRRAREAHLSALISATSDVIYRMNADWSEMQPLDGRALVASNSAPLRGWLEQNLPAFEHERMRSASASAIANKTTFELEHQVVRPDGSLGWTFSRAIPILDGSGAIAEWLGAASDVTMRKQAEEGQRAIGVRLSAALLESERQKRLYETALSNTPDLVYVFDLSHRFTFANEALLSLWGKTWNEAIGKTCLELGYEPWHAAMHDEEIERVRSTKRPIRGEVPFGGMDGGGRRVYDYIFVPVLGASGEVEAVAGTTRDITARQAMEQELREAGRKKDNFIAVLGHELRNPLAPISSGLALLENEPKPELRQKTIGIMQRQVVHMVRLIDDLLDVSRITQGKLELRRERISLTSAIDAAIEGSQLHLARGRHTLKRSLGDEPMFLDADHTRIAQVISNLLDNASKYTPNGGEIELSARREMRREGDDVVIAVRDSGLGIPKERLEDVFEMFSQVNRALHRSHGGLGIGLSLVRRLVELHGGKVAAFSEGPGKGSTFTVRLPLAHGASPEVLVSSEAHRPRVAGARVLVVDDNKDAVELLVLALDEAGYQTVSAHDGIAALAAVEHVVPDIAILDIGLPGMSGYELAQQLRKDVRFALTAFIALTGWGTHDDRMRALSAGFDMHLTKPVSRRDLALALDRADTLRRGRTTELT